MSNHALTGAPPVYTDFDQAKFINKLMAGTSLRNLSIGKPSHGKLQHSGSGLLRLSKALKESDLLVANLRAGPRKLIIVFGFLLKQNQKGAPPPNERPNVRYRGTGQNEQGHPLSSLESHQKASHTKDARPQLYRGFPDPPKAGAPFVPWTLEVRPNFRTLICRHSISQVQDKGGLSNPWHLNSQANLD